MITLKEYEPKDWLAITDAVEPFSPLMPTEEFLKMTENGLAITAIENDKVMACGGITYVGDEGVVWVKISKKCKGYSWARSIRETFRLMMDSIGDLKISTYIVSGFCKGDKLARLIGLHKTDEFETYKGKVYYKWLQQH